MKLILATGNEHKVEELQEMLKDLDFGITSLKDYPEVGEIIEDGKTFEENALKKARQVFNTTGEWSLADDSGLVVDALNGEPGIYSSRYSGKEKDYAANNEKLLKEMTGVPEDKRSARFVSVMALVGPNGEEYIVKGECEGFITEKLIGNQGFGYDPLFFIPDKKKTMAELSMDEKNEISHRGKALEKMRDLLLDLFEKGV